MEWFAAVSGLRYMEKDTPPGTFTFTPAKDKQYTLAEIVDILNDAAHWLQQEAIPVRTHPPRGGRSPSSSRRMAATPPHSHPAHKPRRAPNKGSARRKLSIVEGRLKGGRSSGHHHPVHKRMGPGDRRRRGRTLTFGTWSIPPAVEGRHRCLLRATDELAQGATRRRSGCPNRQFEASPSSPDGNVVLGVCRERPRPGLGHGYGEGADHLEDGRHQVPRAGNFAGPWTS